MTRVKICGCMRAADAIAAAKAGADFIGIMFADSRRRVSPREASQIVRAVGAPLREMEQDEPPPLHPGHFDTIDAWFEHGAQALDRLLARKRPLVVGVFEDQDPEEINNIADETGIDLVQLSGSEPWSDCLLVNRPAIKVLRQQPGMAAADMLACIEPGAAIAFMLDPSRGTGAKGDWAAAADVADRLPLWLAGGLSPDNVAKAIREVRPWAVDVSSGVEVDGAKDASRIAAFVRAVREEDRRPRGSTMRSARASTSARTDRSSVLPRSVGTPTHTDRPSDPSRSVDTSTRTRTDRSLDLSRPVGYTDPPPQRKSSPRLAGFAYRGGYQYHVVLSAASRTRPFAAHEWAELAVTVLYDVARDTSFAVDAYCVMPDHVHVLVSGDAAADSDLARFVHRYKQALGFKFKRATGAQLWHRSYYDHVLRPDEPAIVHASYIVSNPVAAGLVETAGAWPYSGPVELLQELTGEDRSEDLPLRVDELAQRMDRELKGTSS